LFGVGLLLLLIDCELQVVSGQRYYQSAELTLGFIISPAPNPAPNPTPNPNLTPIPNPTLT